jgi:hypothetical protein
MSPANTNQNVQSVSDQPLRRASWRRDLVIRFCWLVNLLSLIAFAAWIARDGQFMQPQTTRAATRQAGGYHYEIFSTTLMTPEKRQLFVRLAIGAAVSGLGILIGLVLGPPRHRRLRTWLSVTALAAAWLALAAAWPKLNLAGQQIRLSRHLPGFEEVANELRDSWPREDGASQALGPFSAYPIGVPNILTPLTRAAIEGFPITSVTRSSEGALGFQLAGNELGAWLEWHPKGSVPKSFLGGLEVSYDLTDVRSLGGNWYLTRHAEKP